MLEININGNIVIIKQDGGTKRRSIGTIGDVISHAKWELYENGDQTRSLASGTFENGITLNGETLTRENIEEKTEGLFSSGGGATLTPAQEKRLLPDPIGQSVYDAMELAGTLENRYYTTYDDSTP